jgi:hypothetical protein
VEVLDGAGEMALRFIIEERSACFGAETGCGEANWVNELVDAV